ncbi:MAG TPA: hypothetical protein VJJ47_00385 [Candidatus Paceibacterota bacterium]
MSFQSSPNVSSYADELAIESAFLGLTPAELTASRAEAAEELRVMGGIRFNTGGPGMKMDYEDDVLRQPHS